MKFLRIFAVLLAVITGLASVAAGIDPRATFPFAIALFLIVAGAVRSYTTPSAKAPSTVTDGEAEK